VGRVKAASYLKKASEKLNPHYAQGKLPPATLFPLMNYNQQNTKILHFHKLSRRLRAPGLWNFYPMSNSYLYYVVSVNLMKNSKLATIYLTAITISLALLGFSISASNQAQAQAGEGFKADLSGKDEVPPTESNATGTAEILFNNDSSQASYFVNTTGFEKITGAHIHNGSQGVNGDVVAALSKEKSSKNKDNPSIWFAGDIKSSDLQGPLKGKEISDLANLLNNGSAYVNVHTEDNPDGAIRGQLSAGEVQTDHFSKSSESDKASSDKASSDKASSNKGY
jgi:hypothetical protein